MSSVAASSDRRFFALNAVVSALALAFLGWLLLLPRSGNNPMDVSALPALNASLNATSAALLTMGWFAIRRGKRSLHRGLMIGAFCVSAAFLVSYIVYHYVHGDTHYGGQGALRTIYLLILASHILLSIAVLPLVLTTFYFAFRGRFDRHRRLARWTLPIWLYVSVTGVVVFFLLRGSYPS